MIQPGSRVLINLCWPPVPWDGEAATVLSVGSDGLAEIRMDEPRWEEEMRREGFAPTIHVESLLPLEGSA